MKVGFEHEFERAERREKWRKRMLHLSIWLISIALVVTLAYVIVRFAFEKTNMADAGMTPTLLYQDTIIINKTAYWFSEPQRFDVIVFQQGGKEHRYYCIRRIIGCPGEEVRIVDGEVYINGKLLDETVNVDKMLLSGLAQEPIVLEQDEYFVLGDNRNDCEDSRFASICNVVKADIIGKAWIRTNSFAFIQQQNKKSEESEK